MSAIASFGQTQQALLSALLHQRKGMAVDELSKFLGISRNAVNQHLAALESQGLITTAAYSSTGGRPRKLFSLTEKGLEIFPRHYDLLANMLLSLIENQLGRDTLADYMKVLGKQIAEQYQGQIQGDLEEKLQNIAAVMLQLGYASRIEDGCLLANNCVFHRLAEQCNEVCEMDLALLASLLPGFTVHHKECMVKGGNHCAFEFKPKS